MGLTQRLVVGFDLDMTLVDSRPGIVATLQELARETATPIDADLVVSRLGPTLETELAVWFAPERAGTGADAVLASLVEFPAWLSGYLERA